MLSQEATEDSRTQVAKKPQVKRCHRRKEATPAKGPHLQRSHTCKEVTEEATAQKKLFSCGSSINLSLAPNHCFQLWKNQQNRMNKPPLFKTAFKSLCAVAALSVNRLRVRHNTSSSETLSVPPRSFAKVITVLWSQCSSKTRNGVTIFDNRKFVVIMPHFFVARTGNGC